MFCTPAGHGISKHLTADLPQSSRCLDDTPGETERPAHPESGAMPPQNGVGLDHASQSYQAWPKPQPYQQCPVTAMQLQTMWCAPQGYIELAPKKEVLSFKPPPRPEQINDKCPEQMKDRKHHSE
jgi:hypothetical protein